MNRIASTNLLQQQRQHHLFSFLRSTTTILPPQQQQTRHYRAPPEYTRRGGRDIHWHVDGTLPRVRPTPNTKPLPFPDNRRVDEWSTERAVLGQNDYIDILGDGSLHPRDLLFSPRYIRGLENSRWEIRRLFRKQRAVQRWMPFENPAKWNMLRKRIRYLMQWHNYKQNHKAWKIWYDAP